MVNSYFVELVEHPLEEELHTNDEQSLIEAEKYIEYEQESLNEHISYFLDGDKSHVLLQNLRVRNLNLYYDESTDPTYVIPYDSG